MHRRTLLTSSAALAATGLAPRAAARPRTGRGTTGAPVLVTRTTAGRVRGEQAAHSVVFRGVPYTAPPTGALRFAAPVPPRPWSSVRDATRFSRPFLAPSARDGSEDALYANVWTPDVRGKRPVLVYVHGGAWMHNSAVNPTYDGDFPAGRGDLVVVTFNYRLGPFGFGLHEGFGAGGGAPANWGLRDQAALLRWVRANAAAFGGDPENITLAGTSAGGSSAWQLALLPATRALVRRLVLISVAHTWQPIMSLTPRDSRTTYEAVARRLGTTVPGLRRVPALELLDAWEARFAGPPQSRPVASGREMRGPVVDGRWMRGYDFALPVPDLPMLVAHTRTEGSFFTDLTAPEPRDEDALRRMVRAFLLKGAATVPDRLVTDVIAAYRAAAVADGLPADPFALYTEIYGDGLFRYQIQRLLERRARTGGAPQYHLDFAHPVRPPRHGTPHEATSPFLFGTLGLPENAPVYGNGPLEHRVAGTLVDLVASFAHTGVPRGPHAPPWPVFDPRRPSTLVLGGERVAYVGAAPKTRQLAFWDEAGWVPRP
ncbi:carboxylesterase family protein [Streptomyces sp. NPDC003077]|uniref:carboxylesterase family protein n=1 Tax=Streptomyces sp. NPDC003077 TaxID=3154443 RepID=UPI0033A5B727